MIKKKIDKKEIRKVIRRLKDRKAAGADEIPSEVWKYEGEEIMKWILEVCNKVWRGKGWPREWKERILVSLLKKKNKDRKYRKLQRNVNNSNSI